MDENPAYGSREEGALRGTELWVAGEGRGRLVSRVVFFCSGWWLYWLLERVLIPDGWATVYIHFLACALLQEPRATCSAGESAT